MDEPPGRPGYAAWMLLRHDRAVQRPLGPLADGVLLIAVSARARIAAFSASGLVLAPGRSSRAVGDAPNWVELG
jgi:hypothetical protein